MNTIKVTRVIKLSILLIILCCVCTILSTCLLRVPICKGKIFGFARPYVMVFYPPKDLYKFLLNEKVDIATLRSDQIFEFNIKYIGPYLFGIIFDKYSGYMRFDTDDLKLKLKIDFYDDGKLILSKELANNKREDGFTKEMSSIEWEFYAPKELPINKNISCKLTVLAVDEQFSKKYTGARLFIHKRSEE